MLGWRPPRGAGTNLPGAVDPPGDRWGASLSGHIRLLLSTAAAHQRAYCSVLLQDSRQVLLKWYSPAGGSGRTKERDSLTLESEFEVRSTTEANVAGGEPL